MNRQLVHATCIAIAGRGVLLLGDSGAGKSDLALRFIDRGAQLVSDDQVEMTHDNGALWANPPEKIRGLLEARGVGLLRLLPVDNIPVALAVQLVAREAVERMPEPQFWGCLGATLPLLSLYAFDSSTEAKIRFYLAQELK